ncbi:hypothetical protein P3471_24655 [Vibrio parahaemolyticus]|nr:hypothetical protein [Vibrio parahaemolyticus]
MNCQSSDWWTTRSTSEPLPTHRVALVLTQQKKCGAFKTTSESGMGYQITVRLGGRLHMY